MKTQLPCVRPAQVQEAVYVGGSGRASKDF